MKKSFSVLEAVLSILTIIFLLSSCGQGQLDNFGTGSNDSTSNEFVLSGIVTDDTLACEIDTTNSTQNNNCFGTPIPNASVCVTNADIETLLPQTPICTKSYDNGKFAIKLHDSATYNVETKADGYETDNRQVKVPNNTELIIILKKSAPNDVKLSGIVKDNATQCTTDPSQNYKCFGNPIPSASVCVTNAGNVQLVYRQPICTETDVNGKFTLTLHNLATYNVETKAGGYETDNQTVKVSGDTEITIILKKSAPNDVILSGIVTDDLLACAIEAGISRCFGYPIPNASVCVTNAYIETYLPQTPICTATDNNGKFTLTLHDLATYSVETKAQGFETDYRQVKVVTNVEIAIILKKIISIESSLEGRVYSQPSFSNILIPIGNAKVCVIPFGYDSTANCSSNSGSTSISNCVPATCAYTNSDGEYYFSGLKTEKYFISVEATGFLADRSNPSTITLIEGINYLNLKMNKVPIIIF